METGRSFLQERIHGVGLCLHEIHLGELLALPQGNVPWIEVQAQAYIKGGLPFKALQQIRGRYPLILTGLGLSLGSADAIDVAHLAEVKKLIEWLNPVWITDELAWQSVDGEYVPIALPLPRTPEVAAYVAERIRTIQTHLGRRLGLENIPLHGNVSGSHLDDAAFMQAVLETADTHMLLDIGHLLTTATSFGWHVEALLQRYPVQRVKQFRLSGKIEKQLIDLLQSAVQHFGTRPCSIASSDEAVSLTRLQAEARKAQERLDVACVVT